MFPLAYTLGSGKGMIPEGDVYDTSLMGWHRLQGQGLLAQGHPFRYAVCQVLQLLGPSLAVAIHIQKERHPVQQLPAGDQSGDVL
jgi:hypothetical protein